MVEWMIESLHTAVRRRLHHGVDVEEAPICEALQETRPTCCVIVSITSTQASIGINPIFDSIVGESTVKFHEFRGEVPP